MTKYDPIELSREIKNIVVENEERKYYRFRSTDFYGGIATADCVGCNLSCHFCWSDRPRRNPKEVGELYSPKEVADKLTSIAEEEGFHQVRISGNEPTIGEEHLVSVLSELEGSGLEFILETNGILLGSTPSYAQKLADFENLYVRVSLKGCTREQFSKLTGAIPKGFELQLQSLRNLVEAGCKCHASIMGDFVDQNQMRSLAKNLRNIDRSLVERLEIEKLKLYPHVKKRLSEQNLL